MVLLADMETWFGGGATSVGDNLNFPNYPAGCLSSGAAFGYYNVISSISRSGHGVAMRAFNDIDFGRSNTHTDPAVWVAGMSIWVRRDGSARNYWLRIESDGYGALNVTPQYMATDQATARVGPQLYDDEGVVDTFVWTAGDWIQVSYLIGGQYTIKNASGGVISTGTVPTVGAPSAGWMKVNIYGGLGYTDSDEVTRYTLPRLWVDDVEYMPGGLVGGVIEGELTLDKRARYF